MNELLAELFETTFSLIHYKIKPEYDYKLFKTMFISYAEHVMNNFLNGKANSRCIIKALSNEDEGYEIFDEDTNTYVVTISESVVKSIYEGNPLKIFVLFHEIAHVYDEFSISNKDFKDANLKKICIEDGIIELMPAGESFYKTNYKTIAIESHANLIGSQLTRDFYKRCNLELTEDENKILLFKEFFALKRLNSSKRDYSHLFDGSSYNDFKLPLSKIIKEIKERYPNLYNNLKNYIGEENIAIEEDQLTEFEIRLYSEDAILELLELTTNPLFIDASV